MFTDNFENGLVIYAGALMFFFVSIYVFYFYKTIKEGKERDFGIWTLIIFSILGSPFIIYAFVKATQKISGRIKVKVKSNNKDAEEISLTQFIQDDIPTERIIELMDINQFCRECGSRFYGNEKKCSNCKKKRVWYFIASKNNVLNKRILIELNQWKELPSGYKIKKVIRKNSCKQQ